ncbi:MAG: saccharopine dehydrogenase NADP-binding domain-containing protein [Pseudomonadota bacterium]
MTTRVLIIGGYGNFGSFITKSLARDRNIQLIIAGRSIEKAHALAAELGAANRPEAIALDITENLESPLRTIRPNITIHTSGPFQTQGYHVANACINIECHYIDLADGRTFVAGIRELDQHARDKGVLVVSGASSVPCLTAALVDHYQHEFSSIESLDYGITTAQQTARGLATTAAILSYTGKPFKTLIDGEMKDVYGWQDLHLRNYPGIGRRMLGNCEIPDLDLFPERYPTLKTIRFYAGLEIPLVHMTLWMISGLVRTGLIRKLERAVPLLLRISFLFDRFGTENSAFHMVLGGTDKSGASKQVTFDLTARKGDGPYIPCMPAILLARKLAKQEIGRTGATPCVDLITLDEYLSALGDINITWQVT